MLENKKLFEKHFVQGEIMVYPNKYADEKNVKVYKTTKCFSEALKSYAQNSELAISVQFKGLFTLQKDPDRILAFIPEQNTKLASKLSGLLKDFIVDCGYLINDDAWLSGSYIIFGARKLPISNDILKQI